jgi:hypothetical protein
MREKNLWITDPKNNAVDHLTRAPYLQCSWEEPQGCH